MSAHGFSQMPVHSDAEMGALQMIHELDILQGLVSGECTADDPVTRVAKNLEGQVSPGNSLAEVQRVFDQHYVAVVVEGDRVIGIISKIDMVQFLTADR
jgi:cystathionine beta-synthase